MYCGVPLGGALAAVVAMFSSEHWQTTFIIGGLAPLLAVPLMILLLPESNAFRQQLDNTLSARPSTRQALFGEGRAGTTLALWLSYFFTLTVMYMLLNWLPSLLLEQGFSKPQDFFAPDSVGDPATEERPRQQANDPDAEHPTEHLRVQGKTLAQPRGGGSGGLQIEPFDQRNDKAQRDSQRRTTRWTVHGQTSLLLFLLWWRAQVAAAD